MRKIGIIGMGYVGTAMADLFARHFDVRAHDPAHALLRDRGNVMGVDLAIVCVPTPIDVDDGGADLSNIWEVCQWLDAPLVCIKSTITPGTIDRLNRSIVGPSGKDRFHFSPEYIGEGKNFVAPWRGLDPRDARSHPFVIVGGPQADDVLAYFQQVMAADARYVATSARAAELAKYMENAYFAAKVTFCNEFARIAQGFGVSYNELRALWTLDPRVEADHTLVFPDKPYFDGKCLPKDLSAIIEAAKAVDVDVPLLVAIRNINQQAISSRTPDCDDPGAPNFKIVGRYMGQFTGELVDADEELLPEREQGYTALQVRRSNELFGSKPHMLSEHPEDLPDK